MGRFCVLVNPFSKPSEGVSPSFNPWLTLETSCDDERVNSSSFLLPMGGEGAEKHQAVDQGASNKQSFSLTL